MTDEPTPFPITENDLWREFDNLVGPLVVVLKNVKELDLLTSSTVDLVRWALNDEARKTRMRERIAFLRLRGESKYEVPMTDAQKQQVAEALDRMGTINVLHSVVTPLVQLLNHLKRRNLIPPEEQAWVEAELNRLQALIGSLGSPPKPPGKDAH